MSVARLFPGVALLLLLTVMLTGGLGDPTPGGYVAFDDVRRTHFDALAVHRARADAPSAQPLRVYVDILGDASDADLAQVREWLARELNIVLVERSGGAPLFLTRENLIATSGAGALGATLRIGMAAEVHDQTLSGCVVAHELLHFLGLHHVDGKENLMYPRCAPGKLSRATLDDWQREEIARLDTIRAVTAGGLRTWADR